jgi:hypothetical protein
MAGCYLIRRLHLLLTDVEIDASVCCLSGIWDFVVVVKRKVIIDWWLGGAWLRRNRLRRNRLRRGRL